MMKAGTPEKLDLNPIGTGRSSYSSTKKIPVSATKRLMVLGHQTADRYAGFLYYP